MREARADIDAMSRRQSAPGSIRQSTSVRPTRGSPARHAIVLAGPPPLAGPVPTSGDGALGGTHELVLTETLAVLRATLRREIRDITKGNK